MCLGLDKRADFNGKPALHALIIGVSDYPYLPRAGEAETPQSFGMERLSSPALAALRIYEWLTSTTTQHSVPLASCRMLLYPSAAEIDAESKLNEFNRGPWGINEVAAAAMDWRSDASNSRDARTFFYFAGHGARRTQRDCVMLLPEFGMPGGGGALSRCIDTRTLRDGMAPTNTFPDIGRTQFYFVDACRITPQRFKQFQSMPTFPVFDVEMNDVDDRIAPVFYAAIPGTTAIGLAAKQTLFSQALLECLEGVAGEPMEEDSTGAVPWRVSTASLNEALVKAVAVLNENLGTEQKYEPGASGPAEICRLGRPPKVGVTLRLDPDAAANIGLLEVKDYEGKSKWRLLPPLGPMPLTYTLEAGNYQIDVTFDPSNPEYANFHRLKQILPPSADLVARCRA